MQSRSEETRERILLTSYSLFLQNGYDTTGVARICEEAKVSKGAFYHHFPSKHDVFLTILDTWIADLEIQFLAIQKEPLSVPEQFGRMADSLGDVFHESEQIPIFLEFWMQSMRDPTISAKTIAPYYKYVSYFAQLIEKGISEGSFSPDIKVEEASKLLVAFAMGTILQCMIDSKGENWRQLVQTNLSTILNGLKRSDK
jgi:AcrR family transcriptional regulator